MMVSKNFLSNIPLRELEVNLKWCSQFDLLHVWGK